ncbi:hypothetical protein KIPB_010798, partial [Kipferlia bialata]|eukprot:g10798.t1
MVNQKRVWVAQSIKYGTKVYSTISTLSYPSYTYRALTGSLGSARTTFRMRLSVWLVYAAVFALSASAHRSSSPEVNRHHSVSGDTVSSGGPGQRELSTALSSLCVSSDSLLCPGLESVSIQCGDDIFVHPLPVDALGTPLPLETVTVTVESEDTFLDTLVYPSGSSDGSDGYAPLVYTFSTHGRFDLHASFGAAPFGHVSVHVAPGPLCESPKTLDTVPSVPSVDTSIQPVSDLSLKDSSSLFTASADTCGLFSASFTLPDVSEDVSSLLSVSWPDSLTGDLVAITRSAAGVYTLSCYAPDTTGVHTLSLTLCVDSVCATVASVDVSTAQLLTSAYSAISVPRTAEADASFPLSAVGGDGCGNHISGLDVTYE